MKIIYSITGLLLSTAACAGTTLSESYGWEKVIQAKIMQQQATEAKKYAQIIEFAGSRQGELTQSRQVLSQTQQKLNDIKSAVQASNSRATAEDFKKYSLASQDYSAARKNFIGLQKDILAKANISFKDRPSYLVVSDGVQHVAKGANYSGMTLVSR